MVNYPGNNITVDWLDDTRRAICLTFHEAWTWDSFYLAQQTANDMIKQYVDANWVDLVYHFEHVSPLPKGYYTHLLRIAANYPDEIGMVLWVGCHPVVIGMIRNISRYHPQLAYRYAFLDTVEEAAAIVGP